MARVWGASRSDCERVDALFEDYLDDDLSMAERRKVDLHLEGCVECRQELALAESVAASLRSLPVVARPAPESTAASPAKAEPDGSSQVWPPPQRERASAGPRLWSHPLLQAAAVLLLLSVAWLALSDTPFGSRWGADRSSTNRGSDQYSEAELRAAEEDLRVALSYFGGLAEKAGIVVRDDVLGERVVEPTRRAFRQIGDFGFDGPASDSSSARELEKNP